MRVLFRLIGTRSNKMAIGAKVAVIAGKLVQTAEVRAGGSYLSSNDPRLHFGLATESKMNEVTTLAGRHQRDTERSPRRFHLYDCGR